LRARRTQSASHARRCRPRPLTVLGSYTLLSGERGGVFWGFDATCALVVDGGARQRKAARLGSSGRACPAYSVSGSGLRASVSVAGFGFGSGLRFRWRGLRVRVRIRFGFRQRASGLVTGFGSGSDTCGRGLFLTGISRRCAFPRATARDRLAACADAARDAHCAVEMTFESMTGSKSAPRVSGELEKSGCRVRTCNAGKRRGAVSLVFRSSPTRR
jgi:hypothetical protein